MEASESSPGSAAPWETPEPPPADTDGTAGGDAFADRPEVFVGAAFAGGLVLAGVLRWLGR